MRYISLWLLIPLVILAWPTALMILMYLMAFVEYGRSHREGAGARLNSAWLVLWHYLVPALVGLIRCFRVEEPVEEKRCTIKDCTFVGDTKKGIALVE